jgi:F-type H+-transporting ATPase subunit epsilon
MKIVISTHKGVLYNDEIEYFIIKNDEGEFAVMKDHVPVISVISSGYVKIKREADIEYYYVLINALLEFSNNNATILAQEAINGETLESARKELERVRTERIEQIKRSNLDYTKLEQDLRKNIRRSKAGRL